MRLPALRRALALVAGLATVSTLATAAPAVAAPQFDDVDGGVFEPAITALAERDLVEGYSDARFAPARPLTRGQLATVLARALDLSSAQADHFEDDDASVHEEGIDAVAAAEIAQGCDADAYCPERAVTRGEAAAMLARAFEVPTGDTAYFGDLGGAHTSEIRALANAGLVEGCAEGRFCPGARVLRGEMALLLARALDLVPAVDPITLADHRAQVKAAQEEEIRQARLEAEQERLRTWERLAECESGGNWHINTGNGYYGGLQFSLSSWRAVGGSGYPHQATKAEQIRRGERLLDMQGWGAWPTCSRKLGLR